MEIPQEIQNKLKCNDCGDLLSCGPVYLIDEIGGAICGRCSQEPENPDPKAETIIIPRTRNGPYEAAASCLLFPCAFASRGCPEKLSFRLGPQPHEANCEYRPVVCPIAPRGSCDWIGPFLGLKEHCDEQHPANVLESPCSIPRPDITRSYLENYLVSAFRILFLLQVKVCVSSGKLYKCVRILGDSKFLDKFKFKLKITGNDSKFVKIGSVLPAGVLAVQEPTAICTNINNLLDFLAGNYEQTEFQLIINTSLNFNCLNCLKDITPDLEICSECQGKLVKCKFSANGCLFMDVNEKKCEKHQDTFCKYQTNCYYCDVNFVGGFIEHLNSQTACGNLIKLKLNSVFRATKTNFDTYNYVLFIINNCENIICSYSLNDASLELWLESSLIFYELKNFKCSLNLSDPQTKHTEIKTLQISEDNPWDSHIEINLDNFPSWENIGLDLKINLINTEITEIKCINCQMCSFKVRRAEETTGLF